MYVHRYWHKQQSKQQDKRIDMSSHISISIPISIYMSVPIPIPIRIHIPMYLYTYQSMYLSVTLMNSKWSQTILGIAFLYMSGMVLSPYENFPLSWPSGMMETMEGFEHFSHGYPVNSLQGSQWCYLEMAGDLGYQMIHMKPNSWGSNFCHGVSVRMILVRMTDNMKLSRTWCGHTNCR